MRNFACPKRMHVARVWNKWAKKIKGQPAQPGLPEKLLLKHEGQEVDSGLWWHFFDCFVGMLESAAECRVSRWSIPITCPTLRCRHKTVSCRVCQVMHRLMTRPRHTRPTAAARMQHHLLFVRDVHVPCGLHGIMRSLFVCWFCSLWWFD